MQVPLTVYSREGKLIAQFGETRRYPARIDEIPAQVKQAFIATEDARFYQHSGIDPRGIARAVWLLATTSGRRVPGGERKSTPLYSRTNATLVCRLLLSKKQ